MQTLAERLQQALDRAKIGVPELAAAMGVSPSSIYQILSGETKSMKGANLVAAAKKLRVEPEWLGSGAGPMIVINIPDLSSDQVRILQLDATGDMGNGAQNDDFPEIVRAMDFDAPYIRALIGFVPAPGRLRLITGRGPSMMPLINPGDVVIVDTGITHFDGDGIYLINTGSGQQIKSLTQRKGTIYVVSANALIAPEYVMAPETLIGGKVYLRNRIDRLS